MKNVAIIPARGGSKRIPRKNIKFFCGKPIIAYSILEAQQSGLFQRIIVSTDDKDIADIAEQYGAEVPFLRPKELSDDYTGTNDVVKHALEWLIAHNFQVDYTCCIYATAPFIQKEYLKQGFEKLLASDKKFVFSVTTFPFPIQRAVIINDKGDIEPFSKNDIFMRSQDLKETFHDAGQFYWGTVEAYLKDYPLFTSSSAPVVLPRYLVQDIDTMEDWETAEHMFVAITKK